MEHKFWDAIFILLGWFITGVCIGKLYYEKGYKNGQVDAIKGEINWTLVEYPDGTREYYPTDELKDLGEHKVVEKPGGTQTD